MHLRFCECACKGTVWYDWVVHPAPRFKLVEEDPLDAAVSNLALVLRPLREHFREVLANLVPIAHAALYAPDAVVVRVSEVVHGWASYAEVIAHGVTI